MWGTRRRFGGRRRGGLLLALVVFAVIWGYDSLARTWQTAEAWQGTIVREHQGWSFLTNRHGRRRHYWDVQTSDGTVRSVRLYNSNVWVYGRPGDWVVKSAGELNPILSKNR